MIICSTSNPTINESVALEIEERHLHDDGKVNVVAAHAPDVGHPATMQPLLQPETVDRHAGG